MEKTFNKMGTIRGMRYAIQLTKRVKGMPGFAPEYRDREVCEVVFNFPHGDGETYVQFADNPPNLDRDDVVQLLAVIDRGFIEDEFNPPNINNLKENK